MPRLTQRNRLLRRDDEEGRDAKLWTRIWNEACEDVSEVAADLKNEGLILNGHAHCLWTMVSCPSLLVLGKPTSPNQGTFEFFFHRLTSIAL